MSAIAHEAGKAVKFASVRNAAAKVARLFQQAAETLAEARMQKALIEAELYRNRYRHVSKNDDDLPIDISVPTAAPQPSASSLIALAKRVYPAILVISIIATVFAATFAMRLAIGLALFRP
jgi:NADH:ubiquinone oxidoreductase subunit B-like Fe-S oxidoreductase